MHDQKGRELHPDDTVLVPMRIKEVFPTDDFCNVTLESVYGRRPDGVKEVVAGVNTAILLRANPGDDNDLTFDGAGEVGEHVETVEEHDEEDE